ncbi:hypothetical protein N9185_00645 [bacterium]|nr:hypothetical protein [Planctomycetota bacterium]MDB4559334.1 hypothetical protein [Planctomycetota bacterium]MDB4561863.1 hypothetical protein [bacterium]
MRHAFALALLAPSLLFSDTPSVAVDAGTKVTKTYENVLKVELQSISIQFGDEEQEVPDEQLPEIVIEDNELIVFTDEYLVVDGGRGTKIARSFDTLEDSSTQAVSMPDGEGGEDVTEGESELAGATVVFSWDGDEDSYTAAFGEDEDGDEDLLEGLVGDADFLFMFPGEEVEVGDSWEVGAEVFTLMTSPSGDLKIDSEDQSEKDDEFGEQFEDNLSGDLEVTLVSIEDDVAKVTFEGVVDTEIALERETPEGAPEGLELEQGFEFSFDVSGTLLWNMESGIAISMEMEADVEMNNSNTQTMGEQSIKQVQYFEGEYTATATFE